MVGFKEELKKFAKKNPNVTAGFVAAVAFYVYLFIRGFFYVYKVERFARDVRENSNHYSWLFIYDSLKSIRQKEPSHVLYTPWGLRRMNAADQEVVEILRKVYDKEHPEEVKIRKRVEWEMEHGITHPKPEKKQKDLIRGTQDRYLYHYDDDEYEEEDDDEDTWIRGEDDIDEYYEYDYHEY